LAIVLLSIGYPTATAQRSVSNRNEVVKKLKTIKPLDTRNYVYRILVRQKLERLPDSVRLDLVYKIGHYQWDVVALRFEQKKGEAFVSVNQILHGSAFPFWKEAAHIEDSSSVKHGQLRVQEFQRLLAIANALYHADIKEKYIGPPSQMSYGRAFGSSGDGTILLQLAAMSRDTPLIIRESGTLHTGDLRQRVLSGYENVRVHLFWEVFYDYLKSHKFLTDMPADEAVNLLVSRLAEPPLVDGYRDYFRQSLYVEVLGEMGSIKTVPALESAAQNSKLEKSWKESLDQDISEAIEKIGARSKAKAAATVP
jgi:hypothetical protein